MADWSILKICLLAAQLISLANGDGDPCKNYKMLIDDGGRSIHCSEYYPYFHDRFITEGWRRVQLESTKEDLTMPTKFVPKGRCGSHSSVWLKGTHPTVEDGIVDRIGCLSMFSSKCYTEYPIQIKNCTYYMVYYLKRTLGSDERYCFGDSRDCPPKTTTVLPSTTSDYKVHRSRGNMKQKYQGDSQTSVSKSVGKNSNKSTKKKPIFKCNNGGNNLDKLKCFGLKIKELTQQISNYEKRIENLNGKQTQIPTKKREKNISEKQNWLKRLKLKKSNLEAKEQKLLDKQGRQQRKIKRLRQKISKLEAEVPSTE